MKVQKWSRASLKKNFRSYPTGKAKIGGQGGRSSALIHCLDEYSITNLSIWYDNRYNYDFEVNIGLIHTTSPAKGFPLEAFLAPALVLGLVTCASCQR